MGQAPLHGTTVVRVGSRGLFLNTSRAGKIGGFVPGRQIRGDVVDNGMQGTRNGVHRRLSFFVLCARRRDNRRRSDDGVQLVHQKHTRSGAPTMYSIVYLVFIPIGHAMVSLFVFGWPEHYCPSLMSNFPIGLTAIGIGGGLTAWLDSIDFNEWWPNLRRRVVLDVVEWEQTSRVHSSCWMESVSIVVKPFPRKGDPDCPNL